MHICIHTYINTYKHSCIHTHIYTHIHTSIYTPFSLTTTTTTYNHIYIHNAYTPFSLSHTHTYIHTSGFDGRVRGQVVAAVRQYEPRGREGGGDQHGHLKVRKPEKGSECQGKPAESYRASGILRKGMYCMCINVCMYV